MYNTRTQRYFRMRWYPTVGWRRYCGMIIQLRVSAANYTRACVIQCQLVVTIKPIMTRYVLNQIFLLLKTIPVDAYP